MSSIESRAAGEVVMVAGPSDNLILWPEDVTVGEVVYPPGGKLGPRRQPYLQMVFIHSGQMTVWIDGTPYSAHAGTASVLLPGHEERFAFSQESETHHSWLHLLVPELKDDLRDRIRRLPWPLPLSTTMLDLVRAALALRTASLPTCQAMLQSLAAHMIWRYIGEAELLMQAGHADQSHPVIVRAQRYIEHRLGEPLLLEEIAEAAAVSPPHLIRIFRCQLRHTPIAYLWQRRVAVGIELLEQTGLPVGVIAERCGFQTSNHFSRRVKEATGRSPLDLRRSSWMGS